ncbi:MAG TPA: EthD family reductase [Acidimicrobiales bacterium]|nr:EthD family reductase [Acidimicrobiales bacterium]
MYTVTVLYPQPADPAAFDTYHDDIHVPIARGMEGLVSWTAQRIEARDGTPPPYHMVVQLSAPTREDLQRILDSPAGKAAAADVPNFATGGAIFLFGEERQML